MTLRGREDLRPYQNWMAGVVSDLGMPGAALWADMGLGKTVATLTGLVDLHDCLELNKPALIVGPKLVAENTWPNEFRNWKHTRSMDFSVAVGDPKTRLAALRRDVPVHIINRENIPWLYKHWGRKWPYDLVIVDEASSFKNPRKRTAATKRLSRFGALASAMKRTSRILELTGTPAPNGYLDLWSQVYLLDGGKRLGPNFDEFRGNYFRSDYHGFKWELVPGAQRFIDEQLADICFSLKSEDYLTLPDRVDNVLRVPLTSSLMKQYRKFAKDFVLNADQKDIVANGAAALTGKLLQLCNGAVYDEDKGVHRVHDLKLEVLENIVEEANGAPVLVAYSYQSDIPRIRERFPYAKLVTEEHDVENRWNAGEFKMLLCHPASAGHGLNLQHGGNIAVWFGLNWSLELYQQFNKRLHRSGQGKPVIIHHIVAEGTADEAVLAALSQKTATQDAVISAVKANIDHLLAA